MALEQWRATEGQEVEIKSESGVGYPPSVSLVFIVISVQSYT